MFSARNKGHTRLPLCGSLQFINVSCPLSGFGSTAVFGGNSTLGSPPLDSRGCSQSLHTTDLVHEDNGSRSCCARVRPTCQWASGPVHSTLTPSFSKHLLRAYCVAGPVLGTGANRTHGYHPHFAEGKLRLREAPSCRKLEGRASLGHAQLCECPLRKPAPPPPVRLPGGLCPPRGSDSWVGGDTTLDHPCLGGLLPPQPVGLIRLGPPDRVRDGPGVPWHPVR